jgi:hypothetical protein
MLIVRVLKSKHVISNHYVNRMAIVLSIVLGDGPNVVHQICHSPEHLRALIDSAHYSTININRILSPRPVLRY